LTRSSILVQQLKINLDTPEAIAKWVEDRRKRWPSAKRIEEKVRFCPLYVLMHDTQSIRFQKQVEEDAKARGELFPEKPRFTRAKLISNSFAPQGSLSRFERARGRGRGRGRGRERGQRGGNDIVSKATDGPDRRPVDAGWGVRGRVMPRGGRGSGPPVDNGLPARPVEAPEKNRHSQSDSESSKLTSSSVDSDSDLDLDLDLDSDMDPVADAVSSKPQVHCHDSGGEMEIHGITIPGGVSDTRELEPLPSASQLVSLHLPSVGGAADTFRKSALHLITNDASTGVGQQHIRPRRRVVGPPKPRNNPFSRASRRTLLRSLLEPEVQVTLSDLSQAIRFIVANDCLRNVELKPGDAEDERREKVLVGDAEVLSASNKNLVEDSGSHTATPT
jgi:hypothetical protein